MPSICIFMKSFRWIWDLKAFLVANSNSSNYCSPSLSLSVTHSLCLSNFGPVRLMKYFYNWIILYVISFYTTSTHHHPLKLSMWVAMYCPLTSTYNNLSLLSAVEIVPDRAKSWTGEGWLRSCRFSLACLDWRYYTAALVVDCECR